MKTLEVLIYGAVGLVLLNSFFVVYFYRNFWFVILSLSVGVIVVIFVNLKKQKIILYVPEKLSKFKFLTSLALIISVFNFSFSVLGYSVNFIRNKRLRVLLESKKEIDHNFTSPQIRGKVFSLLNREICVPNAKITLIHKDTNMVIDIFYTDFKGEFEYKLSGPLKEGGDFKLVVEHPDYKKYITDFKVLSFSIKELEIFLQPKKL